MHHPPNELNPPQRTSSWGRRRSTTPLAEKWLGERQKAEKVWEAKSRCEKRSTQTPLPDLSRGSLNQMTCPFQICDWISLPFSTPNHLWPINSPVQLLFLPNRSDFPLSSLPLLLMDTFTLKIKCSPVEPRKWSRKVEGYCKPHFSCNNYHPKEELINNDINLTWLQPCYSRWWGKER